MLVLLLAYSLARSAFGDAAPIVSAPEIQIRDTSSCTDINSCRTVSNIVWSCLTTIFLCTWVSIHPNIAITTEERNIHWYRKYLWNPLRGFMKYKLVLFLVALLAPEYIIAWAIRQYVRAGQIQKRYSEVPGWTRTHGFFIIMGGFHLFELPNGSASTAAATNPPEPSEFILSSLGSREDEVPRHPLGIRDLPLDVLKVIAPTQAELKDRGKSDGIAKAIALVQTSWFIVQCIARGAHRLPLTELEVVTLAYTLINFFVYLFWWDKPRDVGCPIRVYKKGNAVTEGGYDIEMDKVVRMLNYLAGMQDLNTRLRDVYQVPMFWSDQGLDPDDLAVIALSGALILGMGFGCVHCILWNGEFPSNAELIIWRISCMAMIGFPVYTFFFGGMAVVHKGYDLNSNIVVDCFLLTGMLILILFFWLYIVARVATMVIAFTALRSLPSEAFKAVDWTVFFPHV